MVYMFHVKHYSLTASNVSRETLFDSMCHNARVSRETFVGLPHIVSLSVLFNRESYHNALVVASPVYNKIFVARALYLGYKLIYA